MEFADPNRAQRRHKELETQLRSAQHEGKVQLTVDTTVLEHGFPSLPRPAGTYSPRELLAYARDRYPNRLQQVEMLPEQISKVHGLLNSISNPTGSVSDACQNFAYYSSKLCGRLKGFQYEPREVTKPFAQHLSELAAALIDSWNDVCACFYAVDTAPTPRDTKLFDTKAPDDLLSALANASRFRQLNTFVLGSLQIVLVARGQEGAEFAMNFLRRLPSWYPECLHRPLVDALAEFVEPYPELQTALIDVVASKPDLSSSVFQRWPESFPEVSKSPARSEAVRTAMKRLRDGIETAAEIEDVALGRRWFPEYQPLLTALSYYSSSDSEARSFCRAEYQVPLVRESLSQLAEGLGTRSHLRANQEFSSEAFRIRWAVPYPDRRHIQYFNGGNFTALQSLILEDKNSSAPIGGLSFEAVQGRLKVSLDPSRWRHSIDDRAHAVLTAMVGCVTLGRARFGEIPLTLRLSPQGLMSYLGDQTIVGKSPLQLLETGTV